MREPAARRPPSSRPSSRPSSPPSWPLSWPPSWPRSWPPSLPPPSQPQVRLHRGLPLHERHGGLEGIEAEELCTLLVVGIAEHLPVGAVSYTHLRAHET